MPLVALTITAIVPLLIASRVETFEKEKEVPKKKKITHTKPLVLFEKGKYKSRYFMDSEEYPFFDVSEADRPTLRQKSMDTSKSADTSFTL